MNQSSRAPSSRGAWRSCKAHKTSSFAMKRDSGSRGATSLTSRSTAPSSGFPVDHRQGRIFAEDARVPIAPRLASEQSSRSTSTRRQLRPQSSQDSRPGTVATQSLRDSEPGSLGPQSSVWTQSSPPPGACTIDPHDLPHSRSSTIGPHDSSRPGTGLLSLLGSCRSTRYNDALSTRDDHARHLLENLRRAPLSARSRASTPRSSVKESWQGIRSAKGSDSGSRRREEICARPCSSLGSARETPQRPPRPHSVALVVRPMEHPSPLHDHTLFPTPTAVVPAYSEWPPQWTLH